MYITQYFIIILSRIYGRNTSDIKMSRVRRSVTNNNGFCIGGLDLLTPSFTVTLNYNQLQ
jgi:hypothetical protein